MLDRLTIERTLAASGNRPIVIALSGGGDSTALLHLLAEAMGANGLHAVVVDHALREGSPADAARAASFAKALSVSAEIVKLQWDAHANRGHQAARSMRYAALCKVAREIGARVIVTGHTRDDQAETVLIRAERGSGWRGLAGMKAITPMPFWPEGRGLWLARPLLGARREALRAHLLEQGADWIEDPANANDAFARVRARRTLSELADAGFDPMRLAALAERLAPRVAALVADAVALVSVAAVFDTDTTVIERAAWRSSEAVRQRALAALLAAAGGAERLAADEQVAALDAQMPTPEFRGATLSGAVVSTTKTGWRLTRDRGALAGRADGAPPLPPFPLVANIEAVWDRRLALRTDEPGWSVAAEHGAPTLARGVERRAITAAAPQWLLADRVTHLLGGPAHSARQD